MNELLKMTAHQVKEGKFDKVILAIGSCEAHGQHLAEGCDTIVSYELRRTARILKKFIKHGTSVSAAPTKTP